VAVVVVRSAGLDRVPDGADEAVAPVGSGGAAADDGIGADGEAGAAIVDGLEVEQVGARDGDRGRSPAGDTAVLHRGVHAQRGGGDGGRRALAAGEGVAHQVERDVRGVDDDAQSVDAGEVAGDVVGAGLVDDEGQGRDRGAGLDLRERLVGRGDGAGRGSSGPARVLV